MEVCIRLFSEALEINLVRSTKRGNMIWVALQESHVVKPHLLASGVVDPTCMRLCLLTFEADLKAQSQCFRTSTAACVPYPRTLPSWQVCRDFHELIRQMMSCLLNSQASR